MQYSGLYYIDTLNWHKCHSRIPLLCQNKCAHLVIKVSTVLIFSPFNDKVNICISLSGERYKYTRLLISCLYRKNNVSPRLRAPAWRVIAGETFQRFTDHSILLSRARSLASTGDSDTVGNGQVSREKAGPYNYRHDTGAT